LAWTSGYNNNAYIVERIAVVVYLLELAVGGRVNGVHEPFRLQLSTASEEMSGR